MKTYKHKHTTAVVCVCVCYGTTVEHMHLYVAEQRETIWIYVNVTYKRAIFIVYAECRYTRSAMCRLMHNDERNGRADWWTATHAKLCESKNEKGTSNIMWRNRLLLRSNELIVHTHTFAHHAKTCLNAWWSEREGNNTENNLEMNVMCVSLSFTLARMSDPVAITFSRAEHFYVCLCVCVTYQERRRRSTVEPTDWNHIQLVFVTCVCGLKHLSH